MDKIELTEQEIEVVKELERHIGVYTHSIATSSNRDGGNEMRNLSKAELERVYDIGERDSDRDAEGEYKVVFIKFAGYKFMLDGFLKKADNGWYLGDVYMLSNDIWVKATCYCGHGFSILIKGYVEYKYKDFKEKQDAEQR